MRLCLQCEQEQRKQHEAALERTLKETTCSAQHSGAVSCSAPCHWMASTPQTPDQFGRGAGSNGSRGRTKGLRGARVAGEYGTMCYGGKAALQRLGVLFFHVFFFKHLGLPQVGQHPVSSPSSPPHRTSSNC